MSVSYYTKNGTRVEQKHFDNGDNTSYRPSEIAREIIMNALYEAVKKEHGVYNNIYLETMLMGGHHRRFINNIYCIHR